MEKRRARTIMLQGTMSDAGKSILCAALCRIFVQDGYRVSPFKSQNMALNSFVTADGKEIGRAQAMQAEAAKILPDVRMNPVLLKPTTDVGSQVIVNGIAREHMKAERYYAEKKKLLGDILNAYEGLAEEYDIIVIEGAGSPAELNLKEHDIVNMGLAKAVDAPVLLVGDIDRGGVFAQLYGTVSLLEKEEQQRIQGLIINKFRGDAALFSDGVRIIEELTEKPVLGVVPYIHDLHIDGEDSLAMTELRNDRRGALVVAVLGLPHISNYTDVAPLFYHPLCDVRFVRRKEELSAADAVILPGSKHTIADMRWLSDNGLAERVHQAAKKGVPVLGICGGYQMLGEEIVDDIGSGGSRERIRGLSLLPVRTTFTEDKQTILRQGIVAAGPLKDAEVAGYEIHAGVTEVTRDDAEPFLYMMDDVGERQEDGCVSENVCGTYLHGLFDSDELTEKWVQMLCERKGISYEREEGEDYATRRQREYDRLANEVRRTVDMRKIYRMMGMES